MPRQRFLTTLEWLGDHLGVCVSVAVAIISGLSTFFALSTKVEANETRNETKWAAQIETDHRLEAASDKNTAVLREDIRELRGLVIKGLPALQPSQSSPQSARPFREREAPN